jgi:hypothetical protein
MTTITVDRAVQEFVADSVADNDCGGCGHFKYYAERFRAALAQQEQEPEPVAWIQSTHLQQAQREPSLCRVEPTQRLSDFVPLYTHPPRREWQGLTEEEREQATGWSVEHIEAALKEKNS